MQNHDLISISVLDSSTTSDIVKRVEEREASGNTNQLLKLKLQGVKGKPEYALEIATTFHGSKNVDLETESSGSNDVSGAILSASGKPGSRIAQMGTTFTLNAGDAYEGDTKAFDLEEEDKVVYQTLSALTGRRKYILDAIVKGGAISVREAKRCGIIDSVAEFRSKYMLPKVKTNTATPDTQNTPVTPSTQEVNNNPVQSEESDVPKRRGRKKSTSA
ncbi:MAG: hypothetical protein ACOYN6_00375 [Ignavibacteria bacterium]